MVQLLNIKILLQTVGTACSVSASSAISVWQCPGPLIFSDGMLCYGVVSRLINSLTGVALSRAVQATTCCEIMFSKSEPFRA